MRSLILHLGLIILSAIFLSSCSEKEEFETASINDFYIPLQPGKYITYRLDSLVFPNFGRNTAVHKYQEKHIIDALITDNLGRPSYRVYRYIRDSAGTQDWSVSGTYYITPLNDQIELIDDNMRVIKLHMPLNEGFQWKGNKYLFDNPYGGLFNFSNDDNMNDWDFVYDDYSSSFTYQTKTYSDVWTVEQADEAYNIPIVDLSAYAAKSRSVEKYAKGIGLVFQQYELWEYQPNPGGTGGPFKTGFGVTRWMIDHN